MVAPDGSKVESVQQTDRCIGEFCLLCCLNERLSQDTVDNEVRILLHVQLHSSTGHRLREAEAVESDIQQCSAVLHDTVQHRLQ